MEPDFDLTTFLQRFSKRFFILFYLFFAFLTSSFKFPHCGCIAKADNHSRHLYLVDGSFIFLSSCYSRTTSSISSDLLPAVLAIISCGVDPLIVMLNFFYTALLLNSKSFIFTLSPGQAMYELTRPPGLLASHVVDMLSPRHWAAGGWNN